MYFGIYRVVGDHKVHDTIRHATTQAKRLAARDRQDKWITCVAGSDSGKIVRKVRWQRLPPSRVGRTWKKVVDRE